MKFVICDLVEILAILLFLEGSMFLAVIPIFAFLNWMWFLYMLSFPAEDYLALGKVKSNE